MISLQDVIAASAFRADMQNTNRVLQGEWARLLNEAIRSSWNIAALARPDFQFSSFDVTLASGGSASFAVPADFHALIDVVCSPDTSQEYSLGPFAWQNRRSPGGWLAPFLTSGAGSGATRASLRGSLVYVEPALSAAGTYRLWYCPAPHICKWLVRLATAAALPGCVAAGSGVGKTLTGTSNGALLVDGQAVAVNDRILVKNQVTAADNGVYAVTAVGGSSATFVLTRAFDFNATTQVAVGDVLAVGQTDAAFTVGATNEGKFYQVATFTAIESAVTFTEGAVLDPVLEQFVEVVDIKTAIPAMMRNGGVANTSVGDFQRRLEGADGRSGLIGEMKTYFALVRSVTPNRIIDTDAIGANAWVGGWR